MSIRSLILRRNACGLKVCGGWGYGMFGRNLTLVATALALTVAGCSDNSGDESRPDAAETDPTEALPEPIPVGEADRVDLEERLVREVSISDGPDWMVAGFGSLWVKRDNGTVARVDPSNGEVVADISAGPFRPPVCQGIGASDDAVWACPREDTIVRIDPDTDAIAATVRIDKLPDQGRLVSAAGQLWVLTDSGNELTGVDLADNKPSAMIALPGACADLATDGRTLWATCPQDGLLLRIDAAAEEITDEVELPGAQNASVRDHVWVGFEGGVAQVDPETLEVLAVYEVYPRFGGSLFATSDAVWVREEESHFLTGIDPQGHRIVETIEAPKLPSGGDVVVIDGSVWATAYDDHTLVELRIPKG